MTRLLFAVLLTVTLTPGAEEHGRLTIIVRDRAGQLLSNIRVGMILDADNGRVEISERRTERNGEIVYPDLPWGLYIVQFRGQTAAGQVVVPPEQQNYGLLNEGSSATNGFGVRFAEDERTELFVFVTDSTSNAALPVFDAAQTVQDRPQPIVPQPAAQPRDPELIASSRPPDLSPAMQPPIPPPMVIAGLISLLIIALWRLHVKRQARGVQS